jgi:two-component system capsular synthesis sensor histidine kinase RcsC
MYLWEKGHRQTALMEEVRLLLVEDNALNQMIITKMVSRLPYRFTLADDGEEALGFFERGQGFDLVLMDLNLPGKNGYDTARAIHALPDYTALPIVALTAANEPLDHDRLAESGMVEVLNKPLDVGALENVVQRHVLRRT